MHKKLLGRFLHYMPPVVLVLLVSIPAFGQVYEEAAKLLASDGVSGDLFGASVAVDGGTAVVGASDKNKGGAAYVFVRDAAGRWVEQAKLLASDGTAGDRFGSSVSISGDTAVIGAHDKYGAAGGNAGAAYVFHRDAAGHWRQQAKLAPSDPGSGDLFGVSVSISGDTALIGARRNSAAYVFGRDASGNWSELAKLTAGAQTNIDFGNAVAIAGDTAVIGARYTDTAAGSDAGAAFVFYRDAAGQWIQRARLTASDAAYGDYFGFSVGTDGDTVVIGAMGNDTAAGFGAGAAYVFRPDAAGRWREQARLSASDAAGGDVFGWSVAIDGDRAIIGAERKDTAAGSDAGAAYVFRRDAAGHWSEQVRITASDAERGSRFGTSVIIEDDTALIGANGYSVPGGSPGSAYVYDLAATGSPSTFLGRCTADLVDGVGGFAVINGEGFLSARSLVPGSRPGAAFSTTLKARVGEVEVAEMLPDTNGNNAAEMAVAGGSHLTVIDVLGDTLAEARLAGDQSVTHLAVTDVLAGIDGPEVVVAVNDPENPNLLTIEIRDARLSLLNSFSYPNYNFELRSIETYPDRNGNGAPELGLLLANTTGGSDKLQLIDLASGSPLTLWYDRNYSHLYQAPLADTNASGAAEVAVLREARGASVHTSITLKDPNNPPSFDVIPQFIGIEVDAEGKTVPQYLFTSPDLNGNGSGELLIFGRHRDYDYQHVQIFDAQTNERLRRVFFDKGVDARDVTLCPDLDDNGAPDILMLGENPDGVLRAIIKDAKTGERLFITEFPFL